MNEALRHLDSYSWQYHPVRASSSVGTIAGAGGHRAVQDPLVLAAASAQRFCDENDDAGSNGILAIAGIGMRCMMGFMVITVIVAFTAFGISLLLLAPKV
jgi:hypothetical protein